MDAFAMWLGYALMVSCGAIATAGAVIGGALMFNRAIWHLVDAYGGIKTFDQFRRWYHRERLTCTKSQTPNG